MRFGSLSPGVLCRSRWNMLPFPWARLAGRRPSLFWSLHSSRRYGLPCIVGIRIYLLFSWLFDGLGLGIWMLSFAVGWCLGVFERNGRKRRWLSSGGTLRFGASRSDLVSWDTGDLWLIALPIQIWNDWASRRWWFLQDAFCCTEGEDFFVDARSRQARYDVAQACS